MSEEIISESPSGEAARLSTWPIVGAASAVTLASAALFNVLAAKRAERETPPIGSFVEVDGVRLHYVERGSGPPLVLLHGNGATLQDYIVSGVMDAAAEKYRVIAFDRPGFGYSERPRSTIWSPGAQAQVIAGALERLEVRAPVVVGHSWGTLVAIAMGLDHPERAAALVLLSGYYFPSARPDVLLLSPPAVPILGDVLRYTLSPLAGRAMAHSMFKAMFSPDQVPSNMDDWPLELALRPSQIRAAAADTALMVPAAAELSRRYGELALPVEILAGEGDKIAHYEEQSLLLRDTIEGSALVTVPGVGHMVHYSERDQVLSAIDRAYDRSAHDPAPQAEEVIPPAVAAF